MRHVCWTNMLAGSKWSLWGCCGFGPIKLSFLHSHGWAHVLFHSPCIRAMVASFWIFYHSKEYRLDQVWLDSSTTIASCFIPMQVISMLRRFPWYEKYNWSTWSKRVIRWLIKKKGVYDVARKDYHSFFFFFLRWISDQYYHSFSWQLVI